MGLPAFSVPVVTKPFTSVATQPSSQPTFGSFDGKKTPTNPGGLPKSEFDDLQAQLLANRSKFYFDVASGPFYGFNRPGAQPVPAIYWN
jgi:hypothetical protein